VPGRRRFRKTIIDGYGSFRIADMLNRRGLRTRSGCKFQCNTIIRILRNRLYCGYVVSGTATSEALQDLRIIEQEMFDKAQAILDQRAERDTEKRRIAFTTKGKALLSGNVFCAHCGGKLTTIRYRDRYLRKDGTEYSIDQIKYSCYHKSRKLCQCEGQSTYLVERVDAAILEVMQSLFENMSGAPEEEKLQAAFQRQMAGTQALQRKLSLEIEKGKTQLKKLQAEIADALAGESMFTPDDLATSIKSIRERLNDATTKLHELEKTTFQQKQSIQSIVPVYNQFRSWADEFESATNEQRKMIACQLFSRIEIGNGYRITCELNMTYRQFCEEWGNPECIKRMIV